GAARAAAREGSPRRARARSRADRLLPRARADAQRRSRLSQEGRGRYLLRPRTLNFVGRLAAARSSSELGGGVKPLEGAGSAFPVSGLGASASAAGSTCGSGSASAASGG